MAKKEKKSNEIKQITPARKKEIKEKSKDVFKDLDDVKSIIIPDDAVIQVPISGNFRHAIEDTLNFLMSPMTAEDIVKTMNMIKVNFEGVPQKEITIVHKCIWTLLSLINEINYQAAEQGKTVATKQTVKQSVSDMINEINDDTVKEVIKDNRDFSNEHFGKDVSSTED